MKKMIKEKKSSKAGNIITICVVVAVLCVIAFLGYRWYMQLTPKSTVEEANTEPIPSANDEEPANYINEVMYIGGIGYKEVYETPFKKSEMYVTNKEMWENHPDSIPKALETAQRYADLMLNTGYREILDNEDVYVQKVLNCMDEEWYYNENEENGMTCLQYAQEYAEQMIDKKLSMHCNFLSDTSLVYEDGLIFVRGIVEYEVYSSVDEEIPADGIKKTAIMEIAMHRSNDEPSEYDIVYFNQIKDAQ